MPKWTSNIADIKKLSKLPDYVSTWAGKDVELDLGGSMPISGTLLLSRIGNNGGQGGTRSYYGSVGLRTEDGDVEIDFLDILQTHPA